MNIFDVLEEKEIVVQDYIKKTFDDRFEDIEIQDLLRLNTLKKKIKKISGLSKLIIFFFQFIRINNLRFFI